MENSCFISYRRTDTAGHAGRLYDQLANNFTKEGVFFDVNNIPAGTDFPLYLDEILYKASILLVVIGENWLHAKDSRGMNRLENSEDYVRHEIEVCLERGINIIPILVGGAELPNKTSLPQSLQALTNKNAIELRHSKYYQDIKHLIKEIENIYSEIGKNRLKKSILEKVRPKASIELMKEVLGAADTINKGYMPTFSDEFINTTQYSYSFDNAIIEIDTQDGISIDTVSIFKYFEEDTFNVDYIEDLGLITLEDIKTQHGLHKINCYTSMRYAVLSIECESDRTGQYFYYTFGCCDNDVVYDAKYENGNLYSRDGDVIELSSIKCDFVSVSLKENYGHPPYLQMFE